MLRKFLALGRVTVITLEKSFLETTISEKFRDNH